MIRYAISSSKWFKTLRNEQSRIISCSNHFKNKNAENTKKSTNLHEILYKNIKVNGPMSVASFMKEALTNKNYGYYTTRDPLGQKGDFITNPEISQLFGEILTFWSINYWQTENAPKQLQFIEFGPGKGTMCEDICRTLGQLAKSLKGVDIKLNMIEVSPVLAKVQFDRLCVMKSEKLPLGAYQSGRTKQGFQISWYNSLKDIPNDRMTFVMAHEFLDALPIHKFVKTENGYREVMVDIDSENEEEMKFRYVILKAANLASKSLIHFSEERNHVEVSPHSAIACQEIAKFISKSGGAALIMDYGHNGQGKDTLRGYSNHKQCNVLENVGNADMTADVDFNYLSRKLHQYDVTTYGPQSQQYFLRNMGLDILHERLIKQCTSDEQRIQVENSYNCLTSRGLGTRFKFFAICSNKTQHIQHNRRPPAF